MTGMEPLINPVAGGLVGVIIDISKKVGGGFAQAVGDRRQAAQALKRYEEKYRARYGTLKLLGMQKSVDLESIYTRVRFLDELSIRRFASIEALEQSYRKEQNHSLRIYEKMWKSNELDGSIVANENQYLMVLGGPGAGKSTYLRRIGLEALKGEKGTYKHQSIPVMIELKRFSSDVIDLTETIAHELSNFGFPLSSEFATRALEQGKLLILLDGLDEVPKAQLNSVVNHIQEFVTKYDQNRYVSSCRIAAHRSTWNRFCDIELADFDERQIQQFIRNWFSSELDKKSNTAGRCWALLKDQSNTAAMELAQTPLLLTFLCLVYNRTQNFPANRASLYGKALNILLEEWAAEKRINPGEIHQDLNIDLEKVLLSEIAYYGFINDQRFFTQQELITQIKEFLSDTVDKPKYLDGKAVLDAITIQQGIFVERAEGIYSFSHLTLQEYLAAQYLSQDFDLLKQCIEKYLVEIRWREVFLLVSGLLRDSDRLLELIETTAQNYIHSHKLQTLIKWSAWIISDSEVRIKPTVKRIYSLTVALDRNYICPHIYYHDFSIALRLALALSVFKDFSHLFGSLTVDINAHNFNKNSSYSLSRSINYAHELQKQGIMRRANLAELISKLESIEANQPSDCVSDVQNLWFKALHVKPEWGDLSRKESESLANYLYANELMVRCKEAAVRVSEKVWQRIEGRMLTVIEAK